MDVQLARFALHIMEHEGIKPAELAEAFGVSVRTVRNHVQAVNRSLEGRRVYRPCARRGAIPFRRRRAGA